MKNESELLRMLMLLADTQAWLNEMGTQCMHSLHPPGIKLLQGKNYRLSISALAHIVERHYYKTMRHPGTGKFDIPLAAIIDHLKDAGTAEATPIKGSVNMKRCLCFSEPVGFNKDGEPAYRMVIVTDITGNIVTAYPE